MNNSKKNIFEFISSLSSKKPATKKRILSILKDIREPMYLQEKEDDTQENVINPISNTFHVKEDWGLYIKKFIGQPLSAKELEAIDNFKEKEPTTISRTEIWYKGTDTFGISNIVVIKKMKDGGQFSYTSFQKSDKLEDNDNKDNENSLSSNQGDPFLGGNQSSSTPSTEKQNNDNKDDIIVTKSILFKDDIKGASILVKFLKKLNI